MLFRSLMLGFLLLSLWLWLLLFGHQQTDVTEFGELKPTIYDAKLKVAKRECIRAFAGRPEDGWAFHSRRASLHSLVMWTLSIGVHCGNCSYCFIACDSLCSNVRLLGTWLLTRCQHYTVLCCRKKDVDIYLKTAGSVNFTRGSWWLAAWLACVLA
mgnify:CR=1 FL=1